jgi:DNA replication and repair protein RecF
MRSSLFGIHRDDVAIELAGMDARAYASQGQTRSVVLSLKLGVIQLYERKLGESPIILLDDVDSELDQGRGAKLFEVLLSTERQLLITGTGAPPYGLSQHPKLQVLRMDRGLVTAQS